MSLLADVGYAAPPPSPPQFAARACEGAPGTGQCSSRPSEEGGPPEDPVQFLQTQKQQRLAATAMGARVVHAPPLPSGWIQTAEPVADRQRLTFYVSVTEQAGGAIEAIAHEVSDPSSPRYGQFLSRSEVDRMSAPLPAHLSAVREWLGTLPGAQVEESRGRWLQVHCDAAGAEQLLSTSLAWARHPSSDRMALLAQDFVIPARIAPAVAGIFGLHSGGWAEAPSASAQRVTRSRVEGPNSHNITPPFIRSQYHVGDFAAAQDVGNRRGIISLGCSSNGGEAICQSALEKYVGKYVPDAKPGDWTVSSTNLTMECSYLNSMEIPMDAQLTMGIAPGIPTDIWEVPWNLKKPSDCIALSFLTFTNMVLEKGEDGPWVYSISYNCRDPAIDNGIVDQSNSNLAKIAAMGITVIVSTGDEGAYLDQHSQKLIAEFPATSPWVTAVGGTELAEDDRTERAWNGGGGGFAWSDPVPTWQKAAVADYLATANKSKPFPKEGMYNPKGRGLPDVSAFAANVVVAKPDYPGPNWNRNGTHFDISGGTSAATPTFAALVGLLNGERLRCHGKRLGFLNPLLYAHAEAFTDITSGANLGHGEWGYTAVKGWDPATGLGSPLFDKLLAVVKSSAGLSC